MSPIECTYSFYGLTRCEGQAENRHRSNSLGQPRFTQSPRYLCARAAQRTTNEPAVGCHCERLIIQRPWASSVNQAKTLVSANSKPSR